MTLIARIRPRYVGRTDGERRGLTRGGGGSPTPSGLTLRKFTLDTSDRCAIPSRPKENYSNKFLKKSRNHGKRSGGSGTSRQEVARIGRSVVGLVGEQVESGCGRGRTRIRYESRYCYGPPTCRDPSPYGDTDNCFALLIAFATQSKQQQARETDDTRRPS